MSLFLTKNKVFCFFLKMFYKNFIKSLSHKYLVNCARHVFSEGNQKNTISDVGPNFQVLCSQVKNTYASVLLPHTHHGVFLLGLLRLVNTRIFCLYCFTITLGGKKTPEFYPKKLHLSMIFATRHFILYCCASYFYHLKDYKLDSQSHIDQSNYLK